MHIWKLHRLPTGGEGGFEDFQVEVLDDLDVAIEKFLIMIDEKNAPDASW
jgi:hypothetical protein